MLFIIKVIFRDARVFRRHADQLMMKQTLSGVFRPADTHPALPESKIEHLVNISALLQDRIPAGHSDIRGSVLHIGGYVRTFGEEKTESELLIDKNQLSCAFVFHLLTGDPGFLKHFECLFRKTPFSQRKGEIPPFFHNKTPFCFTFINS